MLGIKLAEFEKLELSEFRKKNHLLFSNSIEQDANKIGKFQTTLEF